MTFFERHPRLTLTATVLALMLPLDLLAGRAFIAHLPGEYSTYYHHGLKARFDDVTLWGPRRIHMRTNSLGFKDDAVRDVPLVPERRRVVFIGDSFTEGIGIPFEQTFVGRVAAASQAAGTEVLNAGFMSGCPKLYVLRLRRLIAQGFRFQELNVFIDISDVKDEVLLADFVPHDPTLRERISGLSRSLADKSAFYAFLVRPVGVKLARVVGARAPEERFGTAAPAGIEEDKSRWTYDDAVFRNWGDKGLSLAGDHVRELARLCRSMGASMTVAVYPWPDQIVHHDLESRQVRFWREFCRREGLRFVNFFPVFIGRTTARDVVDKYFIPGDFHWNAEGHALVAAEWLMPKSEGVWLNR